MNWELFIELAEVIALMLGLLVTVGVIWSAIRKIHRRLTFPKISLCFEPSKTFHERKTIDPQGRPLGQSLWGHVHVVNKSRQNLINCRAYLSDVWEDENGLASRATGFHASLPLLWAHSY
jgi:hypothetical protein